MVLENSLEQTLALILQSLANFFGTTTEVIMENAPAWLAKYGWYTTFRQDLIPWFVGGAFLGTLLVLGYLCIKYCIGNFTKIDVFLSVMFFFIGVLGILAIPIVSCYLAPEIVGLEALIALIKN